MNTMTAINDIITRNEGLNDGTSIHLYFNGLVGLYAGYGISAFLLHGLVDAPVSYSMDMQMPVAVLNAARYERLRVLAATVRDVRNYRCLRVGEPADEDEYVSWARRLRAEARAQASADAADEM